MKRKIIVLSILLIFTCVVYGKRMVSLNDSSRYITIGEFYFDSLELKIEFHQDSLSNLKISFHNKSKNILYVSKKLTENLENLNLVANNILILDYAESPFYKSLNENFKLIEILPGSDIELIKPIYIRYENATEMYTKVEKISFNDLKAIIISLDYIVSNKKMNTPSFAESDFNNRKKNIFFKIPNLQFTFSAAEKH